VNAAYTFTVLALSSLLLGLLVVRYVAYQRYAWRLYDAATVALVPVSGLFAALLIASWIGPS
jgi:hypothetical protein